MRIPLFVIAIFTLGIMSCGLEDKTVTSTQAIEITLMTHDSFQISADVLAEFETANHIKVNLLPAGDAGAALSQAILSKDIPLADIFFGVDNTFLSRALSSDIFETYDSPVLVDIPEELQLDASRRLLPVDYGYVCFNYDKAWFDEQQLSPPQTLLDFISPQYYGLAVVENPATSSPGLAFLLTTIASFGVEGEYSYLDFWRDFRENDVLVTDGWEAAYFGYFSAASDGDRPLVVSYASSPPAELVYAESPLDEPPTASLIGPDMCFQQIEYVGILQGTSQREAAEAFVDYMLGRRFQEDIPLNMFVFPANAQAALPDVFVKWASVPDKPANVPPNDIDAYRESWIEAWTEVVLK